MVLYTTTETLGDGPDRVDLISFRGKELVLKVTDPNYFSLKNPNEILGAEVLHPCIVHVESLLPRSLHSPNKGLGICTNYQGPNLRTWLARATYVAIVKQLELIWQLWQVVAELHRLHIIHLDLKPENVVISEADDDLPKLIDFGHARKLAPEADLCSSQAAII